MEHEQPRKNPAGSGEQGPSQSDCEPNCRLCPPPQSNRGASVLVALSLLTCCFSWISLDHGSGPCLSVLDVFGLFAIYFKPQGLKIFILPTCFGFTRSKSANTLKTSKPSIIVEIKAQTIQLSTLMP